MRGSATSRSKSRHGPMSCRFRAHRMPGDEGCDVGTGKVGTWRSSGVVVGSGPPPARRCSGEVSPLIGVRSLDGYSWLMALRRKAPAGRHRREGRRGRARRSTAAAGIPAVAVAMKRAIESMGVTRTARTLLKLNQVDGFDCQGCAWPDPDPAHRHTAEFCENGAKAVAEEATTDHILPALLRREQHRGPAAAHRLLARPPGPADPPGGAPPRRDALRADLAGTTRSS